MGVQRCKLLGRADLRVPMADMWPDSEAVLPCGLPYKEIYTRESSSLGGRSRLRREKHHRRAASSLAKPGSGGFVLGRDAQAHCSETCCGACLGADGSST
eukprot:4142887-Amphidinium_carterae.1